MTAQTTNRDKLMEELGALDSTALYDEMADNNVTQAIDDAMCDDCKANHSGRCVATGVDEPCPVTLEDWMQMPAREAPILNRA